MQYQALDTSGRLGMQQTGRSPVQIRSFLRSEAGRLSEAETFRVESAHRPHETGRSPRAVDRDVVGVVGVKLASEEHRALLVGDDRRQASRVSQRLPLRVHPLELLRRRRRRHQVRAVAPVAAAEVEPDLFRRFRRHQRQRSVDVTLLENDQRKLYQPRTNLNFHHKVFLDQYQQRNNLNCNQEIFLDPPNQCKQTLIKLTRMTLAPLPVIWRENSHSKEL